MRQRDGGLPPSLAACRQTPLHCQGLAGRKNHLQGSPCSTLTPQRFPRHKQQLCLLSTSLRSVPALGTVSDPEPTSPCSLHSSAGKRRGSSRPCLSSGLRHSQPPCKLLAEQKLRRPSLLPAPTAGRYLGCQVAWGEHSAPRCVLNCTHQPAAKSLIWRVQGALRGSPWGPHPQEVKRPGWAANSPGPSGTPALSLKGFPPGRRDSSAVPGGLPTRERGAGSDGAEPAIKLPQATQLGLFHPSLSLMRLWASTSSLGLLSGFPVLTYHWPNTNKRSLVMAAP